MWVLKANGLFCKFSTFSIKVKAKSQGRFFKIFFFGHVFLVACGILVPQPGMEPMPPAVEAWSLNQWTAREVPKNNFWKSVCNVRARCGWMSNAGRGHSSNDGCVCEKMGERKSQVKVKMQLGGKHGKEKPKINLDLKVKSQSSTESEKKKKARKTLRLFLWKFSKSKK